MRRPIARRTTARHLTAATLCVIFVAPGPLSARPAPNLLPEPTPARVAASPEPVAVIDARRPGVGLAMPAAASIAGELAKLSGLQPATGPLAQAALGIGPRHALAREQLAKSRLARDGADCAAAVTHARAAIAGLAASEAGGDPHPEELADAYGIVLGCAATASAATAQSALANLETLAAHGSRRAEAILAARDHLVIDATANRSLSALTIESQPAGAVIWVDHRRVGRAPLTVHLAEGEHLVAASVAATEPTEQPAQAGGPRPDSHSISLFREVQGKAPGLVIALSPQPASAAETAALTVSSWQNEERSLDVSSMTTLLGALETRIAVVIADSGSGAAASGAGVVLRVWGRPRAGQPAEPLGEFKTTELLELGALVSNRVAAWDGRGGNPDLPVSVNLTENGMTPDAKEPQKWWVYASIIGAVVLGATVVYASDAADDRQKIELTWP